MSCRMCPCLLVAPVLAVAGLVAGFGAGAIPAMDPPKAKPAEKGAQPAPKKEDPAYVLGFKMKRIDGTEEDLSAYKGKVVLMVNVASKCGFTPQYEGLEKLYESRKDSGLVILGFPADNFGHQEPGSNTEIAEFCKSKYSVTFPMFEKISVKGDDQHPLYKALTGQPAPIGGEPKWNFTKFLVDKEGNVVARFEPKVKPDDEAMTKKIDELLGLDHKKDKEKEKDKGPRAGG